MTREVARLDNVTQVYGKVAALDRVSLALPAGVVVGLIGPDGVGKSSLLAIIAGARRIQSGTVRVLDGDMADAAHRARACPRIAYMPQGLGKNLYPDLSVRENIEYFGRLFGQPRGERDSRIRELLDSTGLAPFSDRAAKKLSGGMRQKLGLCCSLIHDPDLLVLDEPTTGVDPLSRRQFWELIGRIRARHPGISVVVATAYMEEAERFDWLVALNGGTVAAAGSPAELKRGTGTETVEAAFVALLPQHRDGGALCIPPRRRFDAEPVITARNLTCRFGDFTAVDRVSFTIERGEIFGFVGSNGCGKTTTMKILTGLLPVSEGKALLFGRPLDARDLEARRRVGYMSQSFSLYTELTVRQNLDLHARLFHLPPRRGKARIAELVARFGLADYLDQRALPPHPSATVARRRCLHEPEILILDERSIRGARPVLGIADRPVAQPGRDDLRLDPFHERGRAVRPDLADGFGPGAGDRHAGRPDQGARRREPRGRVHRLPRSRGRSPRGCSGGTLLRSPRLKSHANAVDRQPGGGSSFSLRRLFACTIRETLELLRDPIRIGFAVFGTTFLMLVFGFGISTDVNNLSFAVLDHDRSHASRAYLEELRGSAYFVEKPPLASYADLEKRLANGAIEAAIEIPPGFGRDIARGRPASVAAWIDGARPFIAQTIRGYLQAMHQLYLADPIVTTTQPTPPPLADIEVRLKYNQDFESVYAMVPAQLAFELALWPAILMALAVVREKELGSITNLYVTPVTRLEFLLGKQLPYVALAMVNFALMFTMALVVFEVPLKGSFFTLLLGSLLYVTTTTAYGMLISAFARTQIAALFGTAILTVLPATMFAGMMVPVSSLSGMARIMGRLFPMSYFLPISVGTFTKGLGFADLATNVAALALFIPALTTLSLLLLRKQER